MVRRVVAVAGEVEGIYFHQQWQTGAFLRAYSTMTGQERDKYVAVWMDAFSLFLSLFCCYDLFAFLPEPFSQTFRTR